MVILDLVTVRLIWFLVLSHDMSQWNGLRISLARELAPAREKKIRPLVSRTVRFCPPANAECRMQSNHQSSLPAQCFVPNHDDLHHPELREHYQHDHFSSS